MSSTVDMPMEKDVETPELKALYDKMDAEHLIPLWTEIGDLMPLEPQAETVPFVWRWKELNEIADESRRLVPVGRGGERRAIALANPGLGGKVPYATPNIWAAIQCLGPNEVAPEHRHSQNAFRFVIEGEGVWTVVGGDSVRMSRGDLLLTPGWNFHGHQNITDRPMSWIDGLDIPFVKYTESTFMEYGPNELTNLATPEFSNAERLWAYPGLRPVSAPNPLKASPIPAFRWEYTDRALREQLALEAEGAPGVVEPGHAAIRYFNPTTGGDVMTTFRTEFHRIRPGVQTAATRQVGSWVFQIFEGSGAIDIDGQHFTVSTGDMVVVPSWKEFCWESETQLDIFAFSDAPIFEILGLARCAKTGEPA